MIIVISPAKTLDFDTPAVVDTATQPQFLQQSQQLIDQLKPLTATDIASLMNLSDKLAGLNMARFQSWSQPFNADNAKQAVLAFKGDVYTGLDAENLTAPQLDFAQQHLRILSGLYGVLKPLDLIQPYRLEMGTKFSNNSGKDLYAFWGEQLLNSIQDELGDEGVLINLASNEYFKAVKANQINNRIITPVFKDWKNGQYKIISFYAKKARGLMARYIIDNNCKTIEDIKGFNIDNYRFTENLSSETELVFTR